MRRFVAMLCRLTLGSALVVFCSQLVLFGLRFPPFGVIMLAGIAWRRMQPRRQVSDAFGTAAFAGWRDLARARLLGTGGLGYVGKPCFAP